MPVETTAGGSGRSDAPGRVGHMHSRTISDHVTAGVLGTMTYGACALFHLGTPIRVRTALLLYAVLTVSFASYRRQLAGLQPTHPRASTDDLAPVIASIDGAVGDAGDATPPAPRRRRLRAA